MECRQVAESEMEGELKKQASAAGLEGELKKQASAAKEETKKVQQEASKLQEQTQRLTTDLAAVNEKLTSSASILEDRDRYSLEGYVALQLCKAPLMCLHCFSWNQIHKSMQRAAFSWNQLLKSMQRAT